MSTARDYVEVAIDYLMRAEEISPIIYGVYTKDIAEEVLSREITEDQWREIAGLFTERSEGLWQALMETFAEASQEVVGDTNE